MSIEILARWSELVVARPPAEAILVGEEFLMLDVSQVDRRSGQDWPYTEKQMEKFALRDPAQQLYPPAGRRGGGATRVRLSF